MSGRLEFRPGSRAGIGALLRFLRSWANAARSRPAMSGRLEFHPGSRAGIGALLRFLRSMPERG